MNLFPVYALVLLLNNFLSCDSESRNAELPGHDQGYRGITLITILNENLESEALSRFVRRAVFLGFQDGLTMKVIEPKKKPISNFKKLDLIGNALKKLNADLNGRNEIVLFIEQDISLILTHPQKLAETFVEIKANVLLPGDTVNCEISKESVNTTTDLNEHVRKFINAGGFIGYISTLLEIFSEAKDSNSLGDLFNTIYKDESLRAKYNMKIDSDSILFHTLKPDSTKNDFDLKLNNDGKYLIPTLLSSTTSEQINIILTNLCKTGNSWVYLNSLGSYLTPTLPEDKISLPTNDEDLPTVTLAIFIEVPTPFMEEFFQNIENLDYPKNKIHLFIHNQYAYNARDVKPFLGRVEKEYAGVKYVRSKERVKEWAARKLAVNWAVETNTDFYFSVDSTAHLEEENTIRYLMEANKHIIAPMLCEMTEFLPNLCNWWPTLNRDGYYTKSNDYDNVAEDLHKGIWNVPFVNQAYLIRGEVLRNSETRPNYIEGLSDPDIAFASNNRKRSLFMHVTNEFHPGHLVNAQHFETGHLNNELYQIFDNRHDWEKRYLHPNYSLSLEDDFVPQQPCQDVFWFPVVTPRFAKEMIEEMENNGNWADGSIEARGDLYPTVDIQMFEIGFDAHFHEFLRLYIQPLQEKAFKDYEVYPPRTTNAFVVRYSAEDQRELKPHFDESTYTLNIALNTPNKDFEGGGCRFTRFNCSVTDTRLGWGFLHPGQFTHKHEGLKVKKGVRYILVSFIDPRDERDDD